jgi:hypothetical protein
MNYRIDWTPSAHDRLEQIWMMADDNRAVLNAAAKIDYLLAIDPFRDDAIVVGDERTFIAEPLAVDFDVQRDARRVIILNVWMIGYLDRM